MFRFRQPKKPFDPGQVWKEFYKKFPNTSAVSAEQKKWYEQRLTEDEKDALTEDLDSKYHTKTDIETKEDEPTLTAEKKAQPLSVEGAALRLQRHWKRRTQTQILVLERNESAEVKSDADILLAIKPGMVILLKAEKTLTAYWIEDGRMVKKSLPNKKLHWSAEVKLPEVGKSSSDPALVVEVAAKFGYKDPYHLFPVHPKGKGNHSTDFVEMVHGQPAGKKINT